MRSQHSELFYYAMAVYGVALLAVLAFPGSVTNDATVYTGVPMHDTATSRAVTQVSARDTASAKIIGASLIASQIKF